MEEAVSGVDEGVALSFESLSVFIRRVEICREAREGKAALIGILEENAVILGQVLSIDHVLSQHAAVRARYAVLQRSLHLLQAHLAERVAASERPRNLNLLVILKETN